MDKDLFKILDENLKNEGLGDIFKNILNCIKRLWSPLNKIGL